MKKNYIKFKYFIRKIFNNIDKIAKNIFAKLKPLFYSTKKSIKHTQNNFKLLKSKIKNKRNEKKEIKSNSKTIKKNEKEKQKEIKNSIKENKKYAKELKKKKKKKKKKSFWKILLRIFLVLFIIVFLGVVAFGVYIAYKAPKFDPDNLTKNNGTLIYDKNGDLITVIGNEKRQNVTYEELPQVLIDAIISTEDANFFSHKGVDLKRLLKATYYQARGYSDAGGASTITMQLSKNSFTSTEASGFKGIVRKLTDIYMSVFYIERKYTKKELFEFYVNYPYLGSGSYGVEQASETYFNKKVQDLTLVEAATIAGLIQAPSAYDPYLYPDKIESRKNMVLALMLKHNHLTKKEYDEAKNITVKSLLVEQKSESTSKYQGFIDTVIQEVIDRTGNNPYSVPMAIYTTLDTEKQDIINKFYKKYNFKDDKVEAGVGVIDNESGEILAVGAGRNKNKEMTFNYATQINRHPGSTAKPLFDYGPGIEYLKWNTNKGFIDKPTTYSNGATLNNWDKKYYGYMTLKNALAESRNTCALQAFQANDNKKILEFVENLGITPEINNGYVGEWHSVGAFNGVNPVQLAGAYAAFGNGGTYHEPHSYTKIKYYETGKIEKNNYKVTKAMSEGTAYIISFVLQNVTSSKISVKGTEIATKTGTSSYDQTLTDNLGLSSDIIQDSWTVTFSKDYTISIWYGYDKLYSDHYNTMNSASVERIEMQSMIVNKIMKKNSKFVMPDTVKKTYSSGAEHVVWVEGGVSGYDGVIDDSKKTKKKKSKKSTETNTTTQQEISEEIVETTEEQNIPESGESN